MDFTTKERRNIHYKQSPIVFADQIIHTIPFVEKNTSPMSKALYNLHEKTIKSIMSCKGLGEIS
jgi:hypothetical protein